MATQGPTKAIPLPGLMLVLGPLVTALARTISVPWNDAGLRGANEVVGRFAAHPALADAGAALVMAGGILLILTSLVLTVVLANAKPRTAAVAGVLLLCGCASIIAHGAMSLTTGQMVRHAPHDVAATVVTHLTVDTHAIDILTLLGSLGWLILGVSTFRSRQLPKVAAVVVGLGGFSTTFTSGGPIRVLVVGTAVLLLVGTGLATAYLTKGARDHKIATAGVPS
jgi:hypothetical protein